MRTAQSGDRVQVHYLLRAEDGSVASSRGHEPLELTIGEGHPRLPGLGASLVGLAPGETAKVAVPPAEGHGPHDPARVRRWSRSKFAGNAKLEPGKRARYTDSQGRRRAVRVLRVGARAVLVDANRRWAGQALVLEVELVGIRGPNAGPSDPRCRPWAQADDPLRDNGGEG